MSLICPCVLATSCCNEGTTIGWENLKVSSVFNSGGQGNASAKGFLASEDSGYPDHHTVRGSHTGDRLNLAFIKDPFSRQPIDPLIHEWIHPFDEDGAS